MHKIVMNDGTIYELDNNFDQDRNVKCSLHLKDYSPVEGIFAVLHQDSVDLYNDDSSVGDIVFLSMRNNSILFPDSWGVIMPFVTNGKNNPSCNLSNVDIKATIEANGGKLPVNGY